MIKINRRLVIVAFVIFAAALKISAQTNPQTVFSAEEPVKKKVVIPEAVVAVLKSDKIVDGCFKSKGAGANENEWFAASAIDLDGDGRLDLIVKAEDACLFGANQAPFWIFQNVADGYQKIFSGNGLQLEVLTKKTKSFRQIKISKVVRMKPPSEIYAFRAGKYQAVKPRK